MAYTGGELNRLNGKYGISAPQRSVPVMKLIKTHRPKSKGELYELIKYHFEKKCHCGIKSKGTVESFGKKLYAAQLQEYGEYKFTLKECIQWEYDLFVVQSLKGKNIELKALQQLQKILKTVHLNIQEAEGFMDEELRIDLIVLKKEKPICGIQVKPLTFNNMREGVIFFNKNANAKWGRPVYYLFYDEAEKITNLDEVTGNILKNI
ncbi:MAG TPA: MjaI family restriction endonuclease [Bacteroidetes bacterium]|nr:MjaI family restriction endonuclease [Bacteroidota bacterium]